MDLQEAYTAATQTERMEITLLMLRHTEPYQHRDIMAILHRMDLWFFPAMAFITNFGWMWSLVPKHPVAPLTILTSSFMSATLTLFLIRPPKKIYVAHWVNW